MSSPEVAEGVSRLADNLSPIVRDAMDAGIVSGERPKIIKLGNLDIENLVAKPRLDADFVKFKFIAADTTSTQREILKTWLGKGVNHILLSGIEMKLYGEFFGLRANYYSRRQVSLTLSNHVVNTDCTRLTGNMDFESVPEGSEVIATRADKPAAGRFTYGKTTVYFHPGPVGNDEARWMLNFYHWALGLDVPGPAAEILNKRIADVRMGKGTHDSLTLRTGDVIKGVLDTKDQKLKTLDGPRAFMRKDIEMIILEFTADKMDKVALRDGKEFTGTLLAADFKILSGDGEVQTYSRDSVKVIRYNVPSKKPELK
ncbi:MAG: hypothetical protein O2923_02330 [Verrucomicrobia bacterium]|nr:hypothetical protein [Verrucomicrobiota bacterium]MDA1085932.1 hypothetical protein [Verrucomicrobiota bacterium]